MTAEYTLKELRTENNMSVRDLANASGISPVTIYRIEGSYRFSVNDDTAAALADALGCDTKSIFWPHGTSNQGRPPHTGCENSERPREAEPLKVCHEHFIELPATGECSFC